MNLYQKIKYEPKGIYSDYFWLLLFWVKNSKQSKCVCVYIYTYVCVYLHSLPRKNLTIVNITRTVCATSMYPGSQGEWTGMCMREQWCLYCTSQWEWSILLNEHVYCMAIAFKMTEWVEHKSASNFVLSFNDSKGRSYGHLVIGSFITTMCLFIYHLLCRVFCWNIKLPRWLRPPTDKIWCPATSRFSPN